MPKFFFDVFDGRDAAFDHFGDMFDGVQDAADLAAGLLADIARQRLPDARARDYAVAVRNEAGSDVYRAALMFRDAFPDPSATFAARNAPSSLSIPDPADLVRRSRETRAASWRSAHQLRDTAASLAQAIEGAVKTVGAIRSARGATALPDGA